MPTATKQEDVDKFKAREIFQNIFQNIFLSNCGNPISFEQTKLAFQKHMGGSLKKNEMKELESLFKQADLTDVSLLWIFFFLITKYPFTGQYTF